MFARDNLAEWLEIAYPQPVALRRVHAMHLSGGKWWARQMADMPFDALTYGTNGFRRRNDAGINHAKWQRQAYGLGANLVATNISEWTNANIASLPGISGDFPVITRAVDPTDPDNLMFRFRMNFDEVRPASSGGTPPVQTASGVHRCEGATDTVTANRLPVGAETLRFDEFVLSSSTNWAGMAANTWWHLTQSTHGAGGGAGPGYTITLAAANSTQGESTTPPSVYHFRVSVENLGVKVADVFIQAPATGIKHRFFSELKDGQNAQAYVRVWYAAGETAEPVLIVNHSGAWGEVWPDGIFFKWGMYMSAAWKDSAVREVEYYHGGLCVMLKSTVPWMTAQRAFAMMREPRIYRTIVVPNSDVWTDPVPPRPPIAGAKYVNTSTGANTGAGGIGAPYQTYAYALAQLTAGQENQILMAAGQVHALGSSAITNNKNGAAEAAPFYVGRYGTGTNPILRSTVATNGTMMQVTGGAKWMQFDDLTFDGQDTQARLFDVLNNTTTRIEGIHFRRTKFINSRANGYVTTNQLQSNGLATRNMRLWYCDSMDHGMHAWINTNSDDLVFERCRAYRTGARDGAHGWTAYGIHVNIGNTGLWTQHSGNVYKKNESMVPSQVQTDIPNRKRLYRTAGTQTAPGNNEFGYAGGVLYVNVGGAPSATIRWSVLDLNYTCIDCYAEETMAFMPYPPSPAVPIFEGAAFQADDCSRFQLTRCHAQDPYGPGFHTNSADFSTAIDCSVTNAGLRGITNLNSKNVTYTNPTLTLCGDRSKKATDGRNIEENNFPYADISAFGAFDMQVINATITARAHRYGFTRSGGGNCTRSSTSWSGGINVDHSNGAWVPFTGT